jgi:hypothetical protein
VKLLFCQVCGDIVAANPEPRSVRWCRCGTHAVWWIDPTRGTLRLFERDAVWVPAAEGQDPSHHAWSRKRSPHRAYVIGLHNGFLMFDGQHSAQSIQAILSLTPDSYLFARQRSLIIRFRPGETTDTDWADSLPMTAAVPV